MPIYGYLNGTNGQMVNPYTPANPGYVKQYDGFGSMIPIFGGRTTKDGTHGKHNPETLSWYQGQ